MPHNTNFGTRIWECYCDYAGAMGFRDTCIACGRTVGCSYQDYLNLNDKTVWKCICKYSNSTSSQKCRNCHLDRGASLVAKATPNHWVCVCKQKNDYSLFACTSCWKMKKDPMQWHCNNCGLIQTVKIDTCRCNTARPKTIASVGKAAAAFGKAVQLTAQSINKLSTTIEYTSLIIEGAAVSKESLNQQCVNQVKLAFTGSPLAKSTLLQEAYNTVLEADQHTSKPVYEGWKNKATHLYWNLMHDLFTPEQMHATVKKCWETAQGECPGDKTVKEHTINLVVDSIYDAASRSVPYEYKGLFRIVFEEVDQTAVATRLCKNYDFVV